MRYDGHVRVALATMMCACGRVSFDELPGFDAPFGEPVALAELNSTETDDDPSLTDDLLEIYFASNRSVSDELLRATRRSIDEPFGPPEPVAELNGPGGANNPKITPDGLAIVFASSRAPNTGKVDLWMSTRASRDAAWGAPQHLDEVATTGADFEPCLAPSKLALYFATDEHDDGDIAVVRRASTTEPFGPRMPVDELSASSQYDGGVWVDGGERLVWFHSSRGNELALYQAERGSPDEPFSVPVPVPGLDGPGRQQDPWLSSDRRTIVFSWDRGDGYDLYIATR